MDNFIKIPGVSAKLTGVQKTAILLAELGPLHNENYQDLYSKLNLTTEQIRKIRIEMENLKPYLKTNPMDESEIYREQTVLNELIEFGKMRGIYHPVEESKLPKFYAKDDKVSPIADQKPEDLAKLLKSWISDEK